MLAVLICFAAPATAQPAPFIGPVESADGKTQMPPLMQSVQQANWVDAAARIDAYLHDTADAMIGTDASTLVSLRTWADTLPAGTRAAIVPEYDKLNGEAAKQAIEAAETKPGARPEDFISVANAYPFAGVAAEAWGRAALRAIDYGDVSAAAVLLQRATDRGWKPAEAQQNVIDAAMKLTLPSAAAVAVATPWYPANPPVDAKRVIPVAAGDSIFIATERGLMAAKVSGELLWQSIVPKADGTMAGARLGFQRPAVLCDPAGKPQVVIVRQIVGGSAFGCLRAYRASDGKPLWSTEASAALGSVSLVSAPTVAGRAVIVIGIDSTAKPAPVSVLAFETMTGRLMWQTPIGAYNQFTDGREPGSIREVDSLWSNSGVSIDAGEVFASTAAGLAVCLDRFDGKIRWTRSYTPTLTAGDELITLARQVAHNENKARDPYKQRLAALKLLLGKTKLDALTDEKEKHEHREISGEVMALGLYFSQPPRWLSTPAVAGDVVVLAAADMGGVVGLDRHTGSQLWEIPDDLRAATLIGASGGTAVFATNQLTAIDVHTAKVRWNWSATGDEPIAGPPSFAGKSLRIPAGRSVLPVSIETGQADPLTPAGPSISALVANEASRNALVNIDALPNLSATASVKPSEPKRK